MSSEALHAPRDKLSKQTRALPIVHKLHAEEVSVAAATALLKIGAFRTAMTPSDATEALNAALKNRSDDVRIPCARALGKFRLREGLRNLIDVFNERDNSEALRDAALWAIGRIAPITQRELFRKAMREEDSYRLKYSASDNHGYGRPNSEETVPFLLQNRLDKKAKEE